MNTKERKAYEVGRWEAIIEKVAEEAYGESSPKLYGITKLFRKFKDRPLHMMGTMLDSFRALRPGMVPDKYVMMIAELDLNGLPDKFTAKELGAMALGYYQQKGRMTGLHD